MGIKITAFGISFEIATVYEAIVAEFAIKAKNSPYVPDTGYPAEQRYAKLLPEHQCAECKEDIAYRFWMHTGDGRRRQGQFTDCCHSCFDAYTGASPV